MGSTLWALNLPTVLNPMPDHYLKRIPTYNVEKKRTANLEHLDAFHNFADNLYIEHKYVYGSLYSL